LGSDCVFARTPSCREVWVKTVSPGTRLAPNWVARTNKSATLHRIATCVTHTTYHIAMLAPQFCRRSCTLGIRLATMRYCNLRAGYDCPEMSMLQRLQDATVIAFAESPKCKNTTFVGWYGAPGWIINQAGGDTRDALRLLLQPGKVALKFSTAGKSHKYGGGVSHGKYFRYLVHHSVTTAIYFGWSPQQHMRKWVGYLLQRGESNPKSKDYLASDTIKKMLAGMRLGVLRVVPGRLDFPSVCHASAHKIVRVPPAVAVRLGLQAVPSLREIWPYLSAEIMSAINNRAMKKPRRRTYLGHGELRMIKSFLRDEYGLDANGCHPGTKCRDALCYCRAQIVIARPRV
jgi:hypothetical protein